MKQKAGKFDGKTVDICGLSYKIKYLPKLKIKASEEPKLYIKGFLDTQKRIIKIRAGLSKDEEAQTLLHEILHGIIDTFLPASYTSEVSKYEDIIVEPLSRLLVGALKSVGLLKL